MSTTTTKSGGPVLSLSELRVFDPRAPERAGESDFCCPLCGDGKPVDQAHRSLSVNLESGAWHCHRCEQSGKLREHWTDLPPRSTVPSARRPAANLVLPPLARRDDAPPADLPAPIADRFPALAGTPGEAYLTRRGLPLALCGTAGVRFAPDWHGRPAVLFPIVDAAGREIAAQGRYLTPLPGRPNFYTEGPKSGGLFAPPGAWDAGEVTITEAPIDALSLCLCGYPAFALVGKSWPEWLPAFVASKRRRVYLAFDADQPDSIGVRAGDAAAVKMAEALRYYDCHSERLRPGRAKDWNAQYLEVAECRRLGGLLFKQTQFLEEGKPHPALSRADLLRRAGETLDAFTAACRVADGPEAQGYNDAPLDLFAVDCLPMWREVLRRVTDVGNVLKEEATRPLIV